jgi:hypothetical protein
LATTGAGAADKNELSGTLPYKLTLLVANMVFFAFDFEETSKHGLNGRNAFLDRVKEPIYRLPVPPQVPAYEHHIAARGVTQIQIKHGPSLPGEYEICKLKTIGWYAAQLVLPKTEPQKPVVPS